MSKQCKNHTKTPHLPPTNVKTHKTTLNYPHLPPFAIRTIIWRKNTVKTPHVAPTIVGCVKLLIKHHQNIADEKLPKNTPHSPYNCRIVWKLVQKHTYFDDLCHTCDGVWKITINNTPLPPICNLGAKSDAKTGTFDDLPDEIPDEDAHKLSSHKTPPSCYNCQITWKYTPNAP